MQTELLTRDNPVALETRRAALRSYNADARTFEAVIATTNPVQRNGFVEILDVTGVDLTQLRGVHLLNNHQQRGVEDILGVVEEAWLEGNSIVARIRASERPEVASIVAAIRSGDITAMSIGYQVSEWRDGTDASGNRTRTAVKWRIAETSMVAVPADPASRTRNANATIRELGQRAGAEQRTIDALIDRGATVEQARSALFDDWLTRSAVPIRSSHNEHSMDKSEAFIRAAGEALYSRTDPSHQLSGAARQFAYFSFADHARECLRRSGVSTMGMSANTLFERAGMLTTSDFPQILANTVGRTLGAEYKRPASGIRRLARPTTMADFRAKSRLKLDPTGINLEKVNEAGEFKNAGLIETGEAYKLDTFGRVLSISRQALVNDDLGALVDLPRHLGQAAQAFEAQALVNLLQLNGGVGPALSDGNAVHHTAHGNIAASGAAPSEATLSDARLKMRKQTSPSGALIDVTPKFLLVPPELETLAEKLLSTIQAADTDDVNVFSKLVLIVEPRLTSATRWWLVSPDVDGLEYAHLAGEPGPQIATQVGFRIDGVEYRVRLDFGCGFVDWRGWQTNAGA